MTVLHCPRSGRGDWRCVITEVVIWRCSVGVVPWLSYKLSAIDGRSQLCSKNVRINVFKTRTTRRHLSFLTSFYDHCDVVNFTTGDAWSEMELRQFTARRSCARLLDNIKLGYSVLYIVRNSKCYDVRLEMGWMWMYVMSNGFFFNVLSSLLYKPNRLSHWRGRVCFRPLPSPRCDYSVIKLC